MREKHAILITAYKNLEQLLFLVGQFDNNFNIYIHIDKKSVLTPQIKKKLNSITNVKYFAQDLKVNWGGVNHLKCYLKLSAIALKNTENVYFNLITGEDYPIQSYKDLQLILKDKKDYIRCKKLPNSAWANGGFDRVHYYLFYDLIDAKKNQKLIDSIRLIQKKLNFKRKMTGLLLNLYGGGTYWTLTRNTLNHVILYTNNNPSFLKRFSFTFCAEEMYFQTIIMNSKFSSNVVTDHNMRFIDWASGRGGNPAFLDESDFNKIIRSNMLFCRKVDMKANKLIFLLQKHLSR